MPHITDQLIDLTKAMDNGTLQYSFTETQDWFSFNIVTWRKLFPLVKSIYPRALEIGSWEGRSAVFTLNELCANGGSIVCIDHFDLLQTEAGRLRRTRVQHNLSLTQKPFRIMESFSFPALMDLLKEEMTASNPGFDWIYVDGSHEADDTFLDAELCWRLARPGAVIIFDDYLWDKEPISSIHHPKRGIDAFMLLHQGEYEILSSDTQYQKIVRKTTQMRIGFLLADRLEATPTHPAFGYDIHIALTIDSSFAMPAAVTIRSAIMHTDSRVTFYVIDLGLHDEQRQQLTDTIAEFQKATIVFLSLPKDDPLSVRGGTWAKISMLKVLPVERVLYLDADTLVRRDLRALWETNLGGKALGAVVDVGHPMGHAGTERGIYFNAGVLLMDLTILRENLPSLFALGKEMQTSVYKDQDVLNIHYSQKWCPLDFIWNAQGLGTYANGPSPDRDRLDLDNMKNDPAIVHFTGPINPRVEEALNPFVQPCTAKPWGYLGSPGHPFEEEWWQVLGKTPWSFWRISDDYRRYVTERQTCAIAAAVQALKDRAVR